MKKLLSLITLAFTTIVLVACSSKPNMDGEYYATLGLTWSSPSRVAKEQLMPKVQLLA